MLIAVDSLMLCSMVLPDSFDIVQQSREKNVTEEFEYPYETLTQVLQYHSGALSRDIEQACRKVGQ